MLQASIAPWTANIIMAAWPRDQICNHTGAGPLVLSLRTRSARSTFPLSPSGGHALQAAWQAGQANLHSRIG